MNKSLEHPLNPVRSISMSCLTRQRFKEYSCESDDGMMKKVNISRRKLKLKFLCVSDSVESLSRLMVDCLIAAFFSGIPTFLPTQISFNKKLSEISLDIKSE